MLCCPTRSPFLTFRSGAVEIGIGPRGSPNGGRCPNQNSVVAHAQADQRATWLNTEMHESAQSRARFHAARPFSILRIHARAAPAGRLRVRALCATGIARSGLHCQSPMACLRTTPAPLAARSAQWQLTCVAGFQILARVDKRPAGEAATLARRSEPPDERQTSCASRPAITRTAGRWNRAALSSIPQEYRYRETAIQPLRGHARTSLRHRNHGEVPSQCKRQRLLFFLHSRKRCGDLREQSIHPTAYIHRLFDPRNQSCSLAQRPEA